MQKSHHHQTTTSSSITAIQHKLGSQLWIPHIHPIIVTTNNKTILIRGKMKSERFGIKNTIMIKSCEHQRLQMNYSAANVAESIL